MDSTIYRRNDRFSLKGQVYVIAECRPDFVTFYPARGGTARQISPNKLSDLIGQEKAFFEPIPKEEREAAAMSLADVPEPLRSEAVRRLNYVNSVLTQLGPYSSDRLVTTGLPRKSVAPLIAKTAQRLNDAKPPSYITVWRWIKDYRKSDRSVLSLVPQHAKRGNRSPRFCAEVETELARAVDDYLHKNKPTRSGVHALMMNRIMEINDFRDEQDRMPVPTVKALGRRIKKVDLIQLYRTRFGPETARVMFRSRGLGPEPQSLLERVEIDHSPLDLILIDDRNGLPLGRPYLTIALDKLTRSVAGFFVTFAAPSYNSVMQCLKHAMTPKDYVAQIYPDIRNRWPVSGRIHGVVLDNGKEFHSTHFEHACADLAISYEYCPVRTPWFKGSVERFFRTLNLQLVHQLPGTTFSNPARKGEYKSEKEAVVTYADFLYLMHKWIIDVYMQSPHSALGTSPANAWERELKEFPTEAAPSLAQMNILLALAYERTISGSRIQLFGLKYHSPALFFIEQQLEKGEKITVRVNPQDIGNIYVFDRFKREYLPVPAIHANYADHLTLHQHQVIRANAAADGRRDTDIRSLIKAKAELAEEVRRILGKRNGKGKKAAAGYLRLKDIYGIDDEAPETIQPETILAAPRDTQTASPDREESTSDFTDGSWSAGYTLTDIEEEHDERD